MDGFCHPIQEIISVYDLGFPEDSFVCRILNAALIGSTMDTATFLTLVKDTDYQYVHPNTLSPDDLILGAEADDEAIVNYCAGEAVSTDWEYKIFTVKNTSCLYSNRASIINTEYTWIPNQEVFYYDGTTYKWKYAYEIINTDDLLDISGNTVNVSGNTFDICTDRIYTNIQIKERTQKRVSLFNGYNRLVLTSCDNKVPVIVLSTPTPTVSPSQTATPTVTPSMTTTPTLTPTKSAGFTPTPTPTLTPTKTIGVSSTPTPTLTPTISVTPSSSSSHNCSSGCYQWNLYNNTANPIGFNYEDCDGVTHNETIGAFSNIQVCMCAELGNPGGSGLVGTFMGLCGGTNQTSLYIEKAVKSDNVIVTVDGNQYTSAPGEESGFWENILTVGQQYTVHVTVNPYNRQDAPMSIFDNSGVRAECSGCTNLSNVIVTAGLGGITVDVGV
jgi:hypothetical protein